MYNYRAYILLVFFCFCTEWFLFAENEVKLSDKSGNYFMSLPVSKSFENGEFHVRLGNDSPLRNIHGENVILWLFYDRVSWKELEKKEDRIWTTSLNEFVPLKTSGMNLLNKSKSYDKFTNNLGLVFKADNPENASVTLYLYAAKKQTNKKKDILLYTSLRSIEIQPEIIVPLQEQLKREKSGGLIVTAGAVLTQEKRDSLMYESSKKNIFIYVESATELLSNANKNNNSPEELKSFRKELENLKIDFETEIEGIRSSGKGRDMELSETIKQFRKICQDFDNLEQEARETAIAAETAPNEEDKNTNPVWLLVGGLGGLTVLLTLFMTAFFKILQRTQKKTEAKAKAQADDLMKKQIKDQQRLMREANRENSNRKKIKI